MDSVERGAALLDERVPGWEKKIDLEKLDMSSTCNCVLGQVFAPTTRHQKLEGYFRGKRKLRIDDAASYGFTTRRDYFNFDGLDRRWRRLIRRRLKAQA